MNRGLLPLFPHIVHSLDNAVSFLFQGCHKVGQAWVNPAREELIESAVVTLEGVVSPVGNAPLFTYERNKINNERSDFFVGN